MAKILAIGNDAALLFTRALVLQRTGAMVQTADPKFARALIEIRQFDLVVICHSVRHRDADELEQRVLAVQADCRILRLSSFVPVQTGVAEDRFDLSSGPHALVGEAQRLIHADGERRSDSSSSTAPNASMVLHPLRLVERAPTPDRVAMPLPLH